MKRLWWIVGAVAVIGSILILVLWLGPKSPILPAVKKQLTSTLILPEGGAAKVDTDSSKYDKSSKLLTYTVQFAGTKLTVSEQPTPEQFVDIPEAYKKVVDGMNNYTTFDVNVGTVHLTKPKEFNGQQVAVLNSKGTLMFVRADNNISDDQWRQYFTHQGVDQ